MAVGIKFNDFRSNVKDLARPNRFLFSIPTPPVGVAGFEFTDEMIYHVKSASVPTRTIGDVSNLIWFGQNFKIGGDPTYDDYSVIFLNNTNWKIKNLIERWVDVIFNPITAVMGTHGDYKAILKLEQLGRSNDIIATYYLHGSFPKSFDAVQVDQTQVNAIEEVTVNFSVDYWSNSVIPGEGEGTGLVGVPI